jgi:PKD repeat protein
LYLHRYVVDPINPQLDTWTRVGAYYNGYAEGQGSSVIHPQLDLFIRATGYGSHFMSWDISPTGIAQPTLNWDRLITPTVASGATFSGARDYALSWDSRRNVVRLWKGGNEVWELLHNRNAEGTLLWTLRPVSTGASGPTLTQYKGAHSRFQYISELDSYLAIEEGIEGKVWAYKPTDWTNPSPNQLPNVSITTPAGGSNYTAPANFVIVANASDPDGSITKVEFFVNNFPAGVANTAPWQAQWSNVPVGQYEITAKATDSRGGSTTSSPITVSVSAANLPPVANISVAPGVSGPTITTFSLSGATSSDPDGVIASYAWQFGDGQTATGSSALHQYATAGDFVVRLTVTDDKGASTGTTTTITVSQPTVNQPPSSIFTVSPSLSAPAGSQFNFFGTGSVDPDGTITDYLWDFGDGTTATTVNASKSYTAPGAYVIRLTVTDNSNASVSSTQTITVTPITVNQPPAARITVSPSGSGSTATLFGFSASTSTDSDGSISQYAWQFGDGTTSTSVSPSKQYSTAGSYNVQLTVTDNNGATNTTSLGITVTTPSSVSLSFSKTVNVNAASGTISSVSALGQSIALTANGAGSYSFTLTTDSPQNVAVTIFTTAENGATSSQVVSIAVP